MLHSKEKKKNLWQIVRCKQWKQRFRSFFWNFVHLLCLNQTLLTSSQWAVHHSARDRTSAWEERWSGGAGTTEGRDILLWDAIYDWIPFNIYLKSKWMQDKWLSDRGTSCRVTYELCVCKWICCFIQQIYLMILVTSSGSFCLFLSL